MNSETSKRYMRAINKNLWLALCFLLSAGTFAADVRQITGKSEERIVEGQQSQKQIDSIVTGFEGLAREYRTVSQIVDGLTIYNDLLQKQVDNQAGEIDVLQESIEGVALIERQIIPLIVNMIDSLEIFIHADVPFLLEERVQRVQRLRDMMDDSDVTAAEKLRQVLEAYQIENEYGRTLEAYKGTVDTGGVKREVSFLRVGRVALLYQTVDRELSGVWNRTTGQWDILPPERYKRQITHGLGMARKQVAPDLLLIPVEAARETER